MMKNKILTAYPNSTFETTKSEVIYIADFTKRTAQFEKSLRRGVEFLFNQPNDFNEPQKDMPCFVADNPNHISIDYNVFDDKQFIDEDNNQLKHGECCFFPTKNDGRSWFSIVEIKDCIPGKISEYKQNIIEKMDCMFRIFRNRVSIPNTLYFIVSFPRKKTLHSQALFNDYVDMKKYKKAFLVVTNSATIIDTHELKFGL
jgi:hypothetical protein